MDNQAKIALIMEQLPYYCSDGTARRQITELGERMDVAEDVVKAHSEKFHKMRDAIA